MTFAGLRLYLLLNVALVVAPSGLLAGPPSELDQYLLELLNRARADPQTEVARLASGAWEGAPDLNEGLEPGTLVNLGISKIELGPFFGFRPGRKGPFRVVAREATIREVRYRQGTAARRHELQTGESTTSRTTVVPTRRRAAGKGFNRSTVLTGIVRSPAPESSLRAAPSNVRLVNKTH